MIAAAAGLLADAGWDGHMDGGWWMVSGIGMIIFWALVIAGVVWVVRGLSSPREQRGAANQPDAFAILDRRLAAGEISPEEHRERRATLRGGTAGPSSAYDV